MSMDLFEHASRESIRQRAPLAVRMRPRSLDEFEGQEKILGPGSFLRRAIIQDQLQSLILYGPPGTGKTALASIIANMTESYFVRLNAVMATVKDIRTVVEEADERRRLYGQGTKLFLDEIHRFNKAQQDALLPFVEEGLLVLIGATTENPFFTINRALLSRSRVVQLEPLPAASIIRILQRALADEARGLGSFVIEMGEDELAYLAEAADGDARIALNSLELAVQIAEPRPDGVRVISRSLLEEVLQTRIIGYDRAGDAHYDLASCLIKSIRGSDPQAALYWIARMLAGGEDFRFISRRLVISAAEDIGLADPQGLVVANAAAQAAERVGMPEAKLILSQAAVYLATAPKSNSACLGIGRAAEMVEKTGNLPPPKHLRDAHYSGAEVLGHGIGYLYPHDFPHHWVEQQYLPDEIKDAVFYEPSGEGFEEKLEERWPACRGKRASHGPGPKEQRNK
jgi:putative ATPase